MTIFAAGSYLTVMTPAQLIQDVGAGRFKPVYYFYGEEDYRKAEAIKYILKNFIPQGQRLLNVVRVSVTTHKFEDVCGEIAAIPMLGERRCVFVDEIQRLTPTQQQKLYALLAMTPAGLMVVLSSPAAHTPDKKSALLREVGKAAEVVRFDRLTEGDTKSRIERFLESQGLTYDPKAMELLLLLVGGDFGGMTAEMEKLALSTEPGGRIGVAEVKALVSSHQEFTIFELIDLIAAKSVDRALYVFKDLLQQGEKPVGILRLLSGHLMNLAKLHGGKQVAGHPFFVAKLKEQTRGFDRNRVKNAISEIARTERAIRRTALADTILLENMIREISR